MQVEVYAVLKDYFEPQFAIHSIESILELKQRLITQNPGAENILKACRFAVNNEFVLEEYKLQEHDTIAVLPPASGG